VSSALSIVKWGGTVGPLAYMTVGFLPIWGRAVRDRFARGR
jgi:hypothetical protein